MSARFRRFSRRSAHSRNPVSFCSGPPTSARFRAFAYRSAHFRTFSPLPAPARPPLAAESFARRIALFPMPRPIARRPPCRRTPNGPCPRTARPPRCDGRKIFRGVTKAATNFRHTAEYFPCEKRSRKGDPCYQRRASPSAEDEPTPTEFPSDVSFHVPISQSRLCTDVSTFSNHRLFCCQEHRLLRIKLVLPSPTTYTCFLKTTYTCFVLPSPTTYTCFVLPSPTTYTITKICVQ